MPASFSPARRSRSSLAARLALVAALPVGALPLTGWVQLTLGDANDLPLRWSPGTVIPYHVHSDGYSGMPLNRVRAAMDAAFATWELPCSNVTSAADRGGRDGDTPAMDGQNVIRFEERALPRDVDPESVLAFTMHVGVFCTGTLAEADITFNAVTFGWTDGNDRNLGDVETVALHEIGHLLGLGHTGFDWAVMYPSIQERVRRDLSRDEEDAICSMYGGDLGGPCARDADCGGGEVCIAQPDSDESMAIRCGPPLGRARAGQACDPSADFCDAGCANGLCLPDGICSTQCRADGDCPRGWLCFRDELGNGQTYGYCLDVTTCTDDIDACPAGEVCTISENPAGDGLFRICVEPPGAGEVGAACRSGDACRSGLCFGGVCSGACDADSDCPAPFTCLETAFEIGGGQAATTTLCLIDERPCNRDADCDAGLVCAFRLDGDTTTTACAESTGAGAVGSPCSRSRDCDAYACLVDVCTAPCAADADCPAGFTCDRAPVFGHATAACVPEGGAPPPVDAARPPPPTPDVDAGPSSDAASGVGDGPVLPQPEAGAPIPVADGGVRAADATGPLGGLPGESPTGAVRRTGDGGGGCVLSAPSSVGLGAPGLALLGLFAAVSGRRRRRSV
jgi:Cys-rich repeat protein